MYDRGPESLRKSMHKEDFSIRIFLRAVTEGSVSIGDVSASDISDRTKRRAVESLEEAGLLEQSRHGRSYSLGEKGRELVLDLLEHHAGDMGEYLANETGHDPIHYRLKDVANAVAEGRSGEEGDDRGM